MSLNIEYTFTCDGCGKIEKTSSDANHRMNYPTPENWTIVHEDFAQDPNRRNLYGSGNNVRKQLYICSSNCVSACISKRVLDRPDAIINIEYPYRALKVVVGSCNNSCDNSSCGETVTEED
jgi:hypothetical protein